MLDFPSFLDLPVRGGKPRQRGLTHVLDRGIGVAALDSWLGQVADLVDVLKIGWGISYVDPAAKERVALCDAAGVTVCLGGTLMEVAVAQERVDELRRWASDLGVHAVEVSNGLECLTRQRKADLIASLSTDFIVLAETGTKDDRTAVVATDWVAEMEADLEAGARWAIAEGRESGTVGLYDGAGHVREELVAAIADRIPLDRVIFETPQKAQQTWFVKNLGFETNLGNVPLDEVLPLETLRLGLRADTASAHLGPST
jgi:phosphosulfolactate synthase